MGRTMAGNEGSVQEGTPKEALMRCVKRLKAYARVGSTPRGINRESEQRPGVGLQAWREVGIQHRRE